MLPSLTEGSGLQPLKVYLLLCLNRETHLIVDIQKLR